MVVVAEGAEVSTLREFQYRSWEHNPFECAFHLNRAGVSRSELLAAVSTGVVCRPTRRAGLQNEFIDGPPRATSHGPNSIQVPEILYKSENRVS